MRERRVIGSAVLTVEGAALALGDRLPSFGGPPITVRDMVHAGDFAANRPIETGWGLRQGHRELQGLSIYSGKEFIDRKTGGRLSGTLQIVQGHREGPRSGNAAHRVTSPSECRRLIIALASERRNTRIGPCGGRIRAPRPS